MKKIFIICSVRNASKKYIKKLYDYVESLERNGYCVHLPNRDTDQTLSGIKICEQNKIAIENSDEVHIFYSHKSQGTHFDMGVAFANNKRIVVIENETHGNGKSFPRMLMEWQNYIAYQH